MQLNNREQIKRETIIELTNEIRNDYENKLKNERELIIAEMRENYEKEI